MRDCYRNELPFYYCLYSSTTRIADDYGNLTGENSVQYAPAVLMYGNISPAAGYAQTQQFGNFADYEKIIATCDLDCPIDENSVLFLEKEPEYNSDGAPLYDYVVRRVARSLDNLLIAVSKVKVS